MNNIDTQLNRLNWDDLRVFLAAARMGSLAQAGRRLDMSQPTVGRRIAALEASLDLRLFQRHAQGLTLTEEGARILELAAAMEEAAARLHRVSAREPTLRGTVRLSAPPGLAAQRIAPALSALSNAQPGIEIVLQASASQADLSHGEADVAIRLFRPSAADLVVRRLGEMHFGLYTSRSYLERHGTPESENKLSQHRLIAYAELRQAPENRWLEDEIRAGHVVLRSDCTWTRLRAAQAGVGIAVLPHAIAQLEPQLSHVPIDHAIPPRPIWLVVHRDLRHVPRIRCVIDFLTEVIRDISMQTD